MCPSGFKTAFDPPLAQYFPRLHWRSETFEPHFTQPLELERVAQSSLYQALGYDNPTSMHWIDSNAAHLDALVLRMAERGYTLEHGRPPRTYADMLGSYLQALPNGIAAGDAVNAIPETPGAVEP